MGLSTTSRPNMPLSMALRRQCEEQLVVERVILKALSELGHGASDPIRVTEARIKALEFAAGYRKGD
jgi:hypothetical protein